MTLRDDLLPLANTLRTLGDTFGVYDVDVVVRVRTYSGAVNANGTTLSSTSSTTLSPRPKVRRISEGDGSFFGGGTLDASNGKLLADELEVGPITPDHATGGYTLAELAPAGASNKRVDLLIGGVAYEIFDADSSKPFRITLKVRRSTQE